MTFPATMRENSGARTMLRMALPYGVWVREDGSEVLFNREYQPIWERHDPWDVAVQADPTKWIKYKQAYYFYSDGDAPMEKKATQTKCERILFAFLEGRPVKRYVERDR